MDNRVPKPTVLTCNIHRQVYLWYMEQKERVGEAHRAWELKFDSTALSPFYFVPIE